MSSVSTIPLDEIMASNSGSVDPSKFPNESFDLYSIPAFDAGRPDVALGRDIGSAKQIVQPNDVLLSRIVPHIRRAWVVGNERGRRLIASGEWIVFRSPKVHPDYLRYLLVGEHFHAQFMNTVAGMGGSLMRARPAHVADIEVPLPPLPEQQRIAERLEQADRLRRTRRYALELSETFLPAAFLKLFGDLERAQSRWERLEFAEVCKISEDTVDPKDPAYSDLPQISSEDIQSVTGELGPLESARQKGVISVNFLVQPDEILFSKIRPKLRKVTHPNIKALCSADIYPIRIVHPECHPSYLLYYMRSDYFSRIVARIAESRSNIPKVNREELSEQTIPLPPLPLQQKFAALVERVERLRAVQRESLRQAEHLFASLLAQEFKLESRL